MGSILSSLNSSENSFGGSKAISEISSKAAFGGEPLAAIDSALRCFIGFALGEGLGFWGLGDFDGLGGFGDLFEPGGCVIVRTFRVVFVLKRPDLGRSLL